MSDTLVGKPAIPARRPTWEWADRVRKVRKDMGLTQDQFAAVTGLGAKRIAAWESGRNPRPADIEAIARQLERTTGVDKLWWIGWADDPAEPKANSGWRNRSRRIRLFVPNRPALRLVA